MVHSFENVCVHMCVGEGMCICVYIKRNCEAALLLESELECFHTMATCVLPLVLS